jgi:hypothetical protein
MQEKEERGLSKGEKVVMVNTINCNCNRLSDL